MGWTTSEGADSPANGGFRMPASGDRSSRYGPAYGNRPSTNPRGRARRYGDLGTGRQRRQPDNGRPLRLALDAERRGRAARARVGDCRGAKQADLSLGSMAAEQAVGFDMQSPDGRSGAASTRDCGLPRRVTTPCRRAVASANNIARADGPAQVVNAADPCHRRNAQSIAFDIGRDRLEMLSRRAPDPAQRTSRPPTPAQPKRQIPIGRAPHTAGSFLGDFPTPDGVRNSLR
jgi:hypothetical protein